VSFSPPIDGLDRGAWDCGGESATVSEWSPALNGAVATGGLTELRMDQPVVVSIRFDRHDPRSTRLTSEGQLRVDRLSQVVGADTFSGAQALAGTCSANTIDE
jgi:hypothetical protein